MNRYFVISGGLHVTLALLLILLVGTAKKETQATYTIDFIGSGKVIAMQQAAAPAAAPAPAETKKAESAAPAPKPKETKKADKKAYNSKSEISAKKQKTKKKEKPAPAPVPLEAPSILNEENAAPEPKAAAAQAGGNGEDGEFEGGSIQTDFATFPYPWYITQVRNRLWSEWEKRRPVGVVRRTVVSFAIARDGKIKDLKLVQSSGDDSFDFSAKSAVINAGPFQPLPMLYEKDLLTVTLEFKQEK